jgi:hypothetical protein
MTKITLTLIFVIILSASSVCAQGQFLRPGESGFGASGLESLTEDVDVYGLSFGTSPGGFFDLCFSYAHDRENDVDGYGPSFTYYVKGIHPKSLTGIGFTVGYTHLESDRSSGSADELVLGASVFANYYASTFVAIQPSLSGMFSIGLKKGSGGNSVLTPSLAIILAHQSHLRPFVGLSYTAANESGNSYASIGVGLVVQWEQKE